jgi:hypothetical protein
MRQTAILSALALSILVAGAALPAQARQAQPQIGARPGTQAGTQAGPSLGAGAGAPTPQQAQKAQQSRSEAEAYLQHEEAAATNRQTQNTDRANRAGSVADEASGASAGGSTRTGSMTNGMPTGAASGATAVSGDTGPSYGPVLNPRQPRSTDPARRNPAEVHDETDSGPNPAAQPQPSSRQQRNNPQAAARRPAWQPAGEPMAPRPLRQAQAVAADPEPVPAPAVAPQPLVPGSTLAVGCQGGSCIDPAGGRINGVGSSGGAGVSSAGRLCNRTGATVQCF